MGATSSLSNGRERNPTSRWRRHRSSRARDSSIGSNARARNSVCDWNVASHPASKRLPRNWWKRTGQTHFARWRKCISAPRMRLLRSITPRRRLAKIGDAERRQTLAVEASLFAPTMAAEEAFETIEFKKSLFCASLGHRQSHKERLLRYIWRN